MSGSQTFYPNIIIMSNRHKRLYLFVFIIFVFKNTFFVFWKWQIVLPTRIFFFWVHRPFYSLWSLGKVQFYKILASSSWVSLTLVTRGIHTITVASHYTSEMWRFFIPGNPFTWSEITLSSAAGTGGSYGWHQKWRLTSTRGKPSQSNKEWFGCKVWHQVKVHRFNSQMHTQVLSVVGLHPCLINSRAWSWIAASNCSQKVRQSRMLLSNCTTSIYGGLMPVEPVVDEGTVTIVSR